MMASAVNKFAYGHHLHISDEIILSGDPYNEVANGTVTDNAGYRRSDISGVLSVTAGVDIKQLYESIRRLNNGTHNMLAVSIIKRPFPDLFGSYRRPEPQRQPQGNAHAQSIPRFHLWGRGLYAPWEPGQGPSLPENPPSMTDGGMNTSYAYWFYGMDSQSVCQQEPPNSLAAIPGQGLSVVPIHNIEVLPGQDITAFPVHNLPVLSGRDMQVISIPKNPGFPFDFTPVEPDDVVQVPIGSDNIAPVSPDNIVPVGPGEVIPVDHDDVVPVSLGEVIPVEPDDAIPFNPDDAIPFNPDGNIPVDHDDVVLAEPDDIIPFDSDGNIPVGPNNIPVEPDNDISIELDNIMSIDPDDILPFHMDGIVPFDFDNIPVDLGDVFPADTVNNIPLGFDDNIPFSADDMFPIDAEQNPLDAMMDAPDPLAGNSSSFVTNDQTGIGEDINTPTAIDNEIDMISFGAEPRVDSPMLPSAGSEIPSENPVVSTDPVVSDLPLFVADASISVPAAVATSALNEPVVTAGDVFVQGSSSATFSEYASTSTSTATSRHTKPRKRRRRNSGTRAEGSKRLRSDTVHAEPGTVDPKMLTLESDDRQADHPDYDAEYMGMSYENAKKLARAAYGPTYEFK